jgi:hypothetical protein
LSRSPHASSTEGDLAARRRHGGAAVEVPADDPPGDLRDALLLPGHPHPDQPRRRRRAAIDRAVTRYATTTGHQLQDRPSRPGGLSTYQFADPATGIRAATIARSNADRVRDDYVRQARQDGMTWQAIGQALGLDQGRDARTGYDLAAAAFETVAGDPDLSWQPALGWQCPSCSKTVTDHGPYDSNPEDNQRGHASGCQRLRGTAKS